MVKGQATVGYLIIAAGVFISALIILGLAGRFPSITWEISEGSSIFWSILHVGFITFISYLHVTTGKGQTAMEYLMTYGWAILIIMVVVAVLFYLGVFNLGSTISQCTFPPGFTCVANKLQAGTAKLYLKIGQGTGHNIMITGINCTQNTDTSAMTKGAYIYYPNYAPVPAASNNINMSSGASGVIADSIGVNATTSGAPANSTLIICSQSNGAKPGDVGIGSTYNGKIYINYTETDTGLPRIAVGTYTAKYEA